MNYISKKKFVKYAQKNLLVHMIKNNIKYEITVITLLNIEALLIIFLI